MAFTINKIAGAEPGGLEELRSTSGTITAATDFPHTGTYAFKLAATNDLIEISTFDAEVASAGNTVIVSVWVRFSGLSTAGEFFLVRQGGFASVSLEVEADGDCICVDSTASTIFTVTAPFTVDTYHRIDLVFDVSNTGNIELFIDGSSAGSGTGDTDQSTAITFVRFTSPSGNFWVDDFVFATGAASASDRLADYEIFAYQNDQGATASPDRTGDGTGTPGDDLDNGTWDLVAETPGNDGVSNDVEYNASGAVDGSVDLTAFGAEIDGDSNIKAIMGIWHASRGTGAGTTHTVYVGNDGGAAADMTSATAALGTAYDDFYLLTEVAAELPLSTEQLRQGFGKSSGGREFICGDMWVELLHVPDAAGAGPKGPLTHPLYGPLAGPIAV